MSLPKYIINFEELTEDLKNHLLSLIDDNIRTNYPEVNTNNIQDLLQQLKDLLPNVQYEGLKEKIDSFIYRKIEGIQKVKGILLDMPAIQNDYTEQFKFVIFKVFKSIVNISFKSLFISKFTLNFLSNLLP